VAAMATPHPCPRPCAGNYTKFLIDRNGQPVKRFRPSVDPREFEDDVRLLLVGVAGAAGVRLLLLVGIMNGADGRR